MSITKKIDNIPKTIQDLIQQNTNAKICTISIIHRTGRPRVVFDNNEIYDISFDNLILSLNENTKIFYKDLLIKYCSFSKKQVTRLIQNIPYRINSHKSKNIDLGFSEIYLQYAKDKHMKNISLVQ